MSKIKDLNGITFGEWTVLNFSHIKNRCAMWNCRCSCGKEKTIKSSSLLNGSSKSCHGSKNFQFKKGDNLNNQNAKGNIPWNKDIKTGIVPKTAFKKGDNAKEIKWEVNENGCWICTSHSRTKWGYPQCNIDGKIKLSHVMYLRHNGEIPTGMQVLHKCDNRACINPSHLFLGTHQDNMNDKVNKCRQHKPIGKLNGMSKLTEQNVMDIKFNLSHLNHRQVGELFDICQQHVGAIRNNKLWKHIVVKNSTGLDAGPFMRTPDMLAEVL